MQAAVLNTLEYVKLLTRVGFSQSQAEGLNKAQIMATQAVLSHVATAADLKDLRMATKFDTQELRSEMKEEIQKLRSEMKEEIQKLRSEMKEEIQKLRSEMQKENSELKHYISRTSLNNFLGNVVLLGLAMSMLGLFS